MDLFGGIKKLVTSDDKAKTAQDTAKDAATEVVKDKVGKVVPYSPAQLKILSPVLEAASVNKIINKQPVSAMERRSANMYVQKQLGLEPTGTLTESDKTAVRAFQKKHGLGVDGDPGQGTLTVMKKNQICTADSVLIKTPGGESVCIQRETLTGIATLAGGPLAGIVADNQDVKRFVSGIVNGSIDQVSSPEAKEAFQTAQKVGGETLKTLGGHLSTAAGKAKDLGSSALDGLKGVSDKTGLTEGASKVGGWFKNRVSQIGSGSSTSVPPKQEK
jgi:peptidoglycan hydrolase-like protein with peptidoglycan-binding domain